MKLKYQNGVPHNYFQQKESNIKKKILNSFLLKFYIYECEVFWLRKNVLRYVLLFLKDFIFFNLFWEREREKAQAREGAEGEKQVVSLLSVEPNAGLDSITLRS